MLPGDVVAVCEGSEFVNDARGKVLVGAVVNADSKSTGV